MRRREMVCVKSRDVVGLNCRTSVNGFFSPGLWLNSSASWYTRRLSLTTKYTCFRSTIFFVHLCTTNPRSSTLTLTMSASLTTIRRGYFLVGERADECVAVRLERTGRAGKARQDR